MSKGRYFDCGDALERVLPVMELLGKEARIAGSLRRGKEAVRDVDVVFRGELDDIKRKRLEELGEILAQGEKKVRLVLPVPGIEFKEGDPQGLQVDVVVCEPEEFGACLLYLTGPSQYNIAMRSFAKGLGLKLNEKGLWRGDVRIAGATEEEIYEALGLPYTSPAGRDELKTFAKQVVWSMTVPSSKKGADPYEVSLQGNGVWHCTCPGWRWSKKKPKTCRHIDDVAKPTYEQEQAA